VMYGGEVVERGPTEVLLDDPRHPYTRVLVNSIPGRDGSFEARANNLDSADGCVFAPQCPLVQNDCLHHRPELRDRRGRIHACIHPAVRADMARPHAMVATEQ
jgi:oligopeptide/dipeptide ABC transporter ATP-binding protein